MARIGRGWWTGLALLAVALVAVAFALARREAPRETIASPSAMTPTATTALTPGVHRREVNVGGQQRSYLVHLPSDLGDKPKAVVLVFHGGGGDAENAVRMSRFDRAADKHGFIAVFPDGIGRLNERFLTFNAGNCCGAAFEERVDDVAFTRALIEDLAKVVAVDYQRLFVTGMSNGGMMSYRLACEAADLFAAAAPVAGANNLEVCRPSRPVALLAVHGTDDRSVKFTGGRSDPALRLDTHERVDRSVAESVRPFRDAAKCSDNATVTRSGESERHVFTCPVAAVEVLAVVGGGHAWPGGERGSAIGDQPSKTVDATEAIWAFFAAHQRR